MATQTTHVDARNAQRPIVPLALDPGETTGYAWAEIQSRKVVHIGAGQGGFSETELWGLLSGVSPAAIIAESFEFRQRARTGLVLQSRNLLGVSRLWADLHDVPYSEQSASQGKAFFTDEKLRAVQAYWTGLEHARDATRHLLFWLTFGKGSQYLDEPYYKGLNQRFHAERQ